MADIIEYRVRVVQRYVVTRFEARDIHNARSEVVGEFDRQLHAVDIAKRLAETEDGAVFVSVGEGSLTVKKEEGAPEVFIDPNFLASLSQFNAILNKKLK